MSENSGTKILITGANGFVGSRLCRRFLENDYDVIAGVREGCDGTMLEDLDLKYRFGDITEPETLPDMLNGIDVVIHNAGLVKTDRIARFYEVNHQGTINMLKAALENGAVKKFILISSLAAAGPSQPGRPIDESTEPHPITEYGRSKLAAEKEVLGLGAKLNTVIIRPPGVYGPGDKETLAFFQALNNRIRPYVGRLSRRIQLVHVDDLTSGILHAVERDTKPGSIYFIAEDTAYTFYSLIGHLRKAVGRMAFPIYVPGWLMRMIAYVFEKITKSMGKSPMFTVEKANEILSDWEISVKKAEDEIGYKSEIPFSQGAKETVKWYRREVWL